MQGLVERFWDKIEVTDTCWIWTTGVSKKGYGYFFVRPKLVPAHRWAYEFCVGPIPEGLTLDHLCRVRRCVNPDHLEPVDSGENVLRGVGITAQRARSVACQRGHPYTGAKRTDRKGREFRVCLVCRREYDRRRRRPNLVIGDRV